MKTIPMPLRLDEDLQLLLQEGVRRTPYKKQELIRLTLRRHLREVIAAEEVLVTKERITNIEPWSAVVVEQAYERMGQEWDQLEEVAIVAQGVPDFRD